MLNRALARAPEGRIHLTKSHGTIQYLRYSADGKTRVYISKKNTHLIKSLIQKEFDQKLLKAAEDEMRMNERYIKKAGPDILQKIYEEMPEEKKLFVDDRGVSDEEFVKRWAAAEYEQKKHDDRDPVFITNRGERVVSKSEKIIADMLNEKGLAYRYEEPLILIGLGTIHPDFKILHPTRRVIVCLEHNGRMDDPDYAERAVIRINAYERNGYHEGDTLLLTFETSTVPLDTELLSRKLDQFFFDT